MVFMVRVMILRLWVMSASLLMLLMMMLLLVVVLWVRIHVDVRPLFLLLVLKMHLEVGILSTSLTARWLLLRRLPVIVFFLLVFYILLVLVLCSATVLMTSACLMEMRCCGLLFLFIESTRGLCT
jgi:hypothetical protein